ncbi:MAG: TRAP transporter large permease [Paracoccaceae bacterium]|nr:TRAP transporter large permease [Paracoccaceae bacterium]MXZ51333.1 TRAP transporter large permease [Paracoccaceae bacterium]MYF45415.1 TRAP transporter large permease [Paracoccaceae bacterium]MYG09270.1 TRAP transporter large permease [Paracoccaceae bacterium]MYI90655.1 TRAP transporter large permease [Paracoccaceae bacterium]
MTEIEFGGLLFGICLVLITLRMPVAIAMFVVGSFGFISLAGLQAFLGLLNTGPFGRVSGYTLSVLPLFLLMGQFAVRAGLGRSLFDSARAWVGNYRGGLAISTIFGCAAFGSICGSSVATAATMGSVAIPEMRRFGYSDGLITGTLAAGGTLGILIPPSLILVIYAVITEQSIGKLFLAALIPGIIATLGYSLTVGIYVRLKPSAAPLIQGVPIQKKVRSLVPVIPVAAIFLLVIGGIYIGVFTPTEGAAIGAAATFLLACVLGRLNWSSFVTSVLETAQATAAIFLILIGAEIYNGFLALSGIPSELAGLFEESGLAPMSILIGILFLYLILGCVMDSLAMILLTVPVFFPLVTGLDFGFSEEAIAIWFGILTLIVVEVGLITPPLGLNVYVINSLAKDIPLASSFKGILPFLLSDIVRIGIILALPATCLWLPGLA